jgi:UDP-N-acetylmuramoylalanine--D-glutamate ligase
MMRHAGFEMADAGLSYASGIAYLALLNSEVIENNMQLNGKKITVVGLAQSGTAVSEFLARRGAAVTAMDIKSEAQLGDAAAKLRASGVRTVLGGQPVEAVRGTDLVVVSPGVPLSIEPIAYARQSGIPVMSEVELAARFLRGSLVGVTGSNGKTTTTALTGELLAGAKFFVQVGGNIGKPLTSLIEGSREDGFIVAELSSFQLETIMELRPRVAVVTNISPDHLDRHGSLESYIAAKRRIFLNQLEDDWAVLNADDPIVRQMAGDTRAQVIFFSRREQLDRGIFVRDDELILRWHGQEKSLIARDEIPLRGWHNVENAMASLGAALAAASLGLDRLLLDERLIGALRYALKTFKGIEHRIEFVLTLDGVAYYNDSKATNVDSTIKALESFDRNIIVILGGRDKGSDYAPLRPLVAERVKHVLLIGEASDKIASSLAGGAPMTRCSTMADAVRTGRELAVAGDTVLLAPACASFDMFENYEHRGRVFKDEVTRLVAE